MSPRKLTITFSAADISRIIFDALVHYCPAAHGTWSLFDEG